MNKIENELRGKSGIYLIVNLINGKRYIGSSVDIYNRLHDHLSNLKHNRAHNAHLQAAWNKYGDKAFIWNILEYCDVDKRFEREQFYITTIKPEYNLTGNVVANFGHSPTKDCRKKISATLKRRYESGEIKTFMNEQAWISSIAYDMETLSIFMTFPNISKASYYFKKRKSTRRQIFERLYDNRYYLTDKKFETKLDLYNSFCENCLICSSNTGLKRYLIVETKDGRKIVKDLKELENITGISRSMVFKHQNATKESPYISNNAPDFKIYYSTIFESFQKDAVVLGKPAQWLEGKIGESPKQDNTEISS